jgi:uncharacterized protein
MEPLFTATLQAELLAARTARKPTLACSLDLQRTLTTIDLADDHFSSAGINYPYPSGLKPRTIYYWSGADFTPIERFGSAFIKLVPTEWGAPTFEIDGIKMLPTSRRSPFDDAAHKVALVEPRGKYILDTCGGLGYFAACCLTAGARRVLSFEVNPDVLWLRSLNPWSPDNRWQQAPDALQLTAADVDAHLPTLPPRSVDAILHDPPRFGIAGDLYSLRFYQQLARVIRPGGLLFHYVGTPNRLTSGRDVPKEVTLRLRRAGFQVKPIGDGLLARRDRSR